MPGNIFDFHNLGDGRLGRVCYRNLVSRGQDCCSTYYVAAPLPTENYLVQNVNSLKLKNYSNNYHPGVSSSISGLSETEFALKFRTHERTDEVSGKLRRRKYVYQDSQHTCLKSILMLEERKGSEHSSKRVLNQPPGAQVFNPRARGNQLKVSKIEK